MPEYFEQTQEVFNGLITKPKLSSDRLKKPPFRFIHDIVTNTMKSTGFPENLFQGDELNGKAIKEKESKIAWINKLVKHVETVSGEEIKINPKKLVAGLEPENTNRMLQLFGRTGIKYVCFANQNDIIKQKTKTS